MTLDLTASNGARLGTNFSSSDSVFFDPSSNPTFSFDVYTPDTAGPFQVTVTCSSGCTSVQTLTFNETALQPPPYLQMRKSGGDTQSGPPGTELPTPLQVTLTPTPVGYDGPFQETITWTVEDGNANVRRNRNSTTYSEVIGLGSGQPGRPDSKARAKAVAAAAQSFIGTRSPDTRRRARRRARSRALSGLHAGRHADFPGNDRAAAGGSTLAKVSGDLQSGSVGSQAALPLVVSLPNGTGQTITWTVTERTGDAERGIDHDRRERPIADHLPLRQHGWTDFDPGFGRQRRT